MISNHDQRITSQHVDRVALIYVRQSSDRQVRENVESTRIQRDLRQRGVALGWRNPVVIEDDLGISATGFSDRPAFQEMLARVAMKEVGIILCQEAGRLSRNNKDWAHLFQVCGCFKTLIADVEQVYDLSRPNDRLVLGMKGSFSELEIETLRIRLRATLEAKAERGELRINLPPGYHYNASGHMAFDPDKRVQNAIETMFDQFDRSTSVRQLLMWFHETNTLFPFNDGGKNSITHWRLPTRNSFYDLLTHPMYAGAYVWGRTYTHVEYENNKIVKRVSKVQEIEDYRVCIRDHHPAYISWKRLLANRDKISENRPRWKMQENNGAIRDGLALLAGILRCGQCGRKIHVSYKTHSAVYFCDGDKEKSSQRCLSFGSKLIDQRVGEELCRALKPLGIKAAIAGKEMRQEERKLEIENAKMQVQAEQYEADRAFEQYDLCDPKNRLVADTLEERLNAKLADLQAAKERLGKTSKEDDRPLTDEELQRLEELARDFPTVWCHPKADPKLKKQLLRSAIHETLVKRESNQNRLEVTIHWQGGVHTRTYVAKRTSPEGKKANPSLVDLVGQLAQDHSDAEIARVLNMKRTKTPHGLRWTRDRVKNFRQHHRLPSGCGKRDCDKLTMREAASHLGISYNGLCGLVRMGAVSKNQVTDFAHWRISRAELDSKRVQSLVRHLKATGRFPRGGFSENQLTLFDDNC